MYRSTFTRPRATARLVSPLIAALLLTAGSAAIAQEKVLRIAMTAADIPRTLGQPDQGFEGNRFTGIPIYDGLTQWDLSKEKEPSGVIPGAQNRPGQRPSSFSCGDSSPGRAVRF
jgi:hypothetical protein